MFISSSCELFKDGKRKRVPGAGSFPFFFKGSSIDSLYSHFIIAGVIPVSLYFMTLSSKPMNRVPRRPYRQSMYDPNPSHTYIHTTEFGSLPGKPVCSATFSFLASVALLVNMGYVMYIHMLHMILF
jgi:hypothetical protein